MQLGEASAEGAPALLFSGSAATASPWQKAERQLQRFVVGVLRLCELQCLRARKNRGDPLKNSMSCQSFFLAWDLLSNNTRF